MPNQGLAAYSTNAPESVLSDEKGLARWKQGVYHEKPLEAILERLQRETALEDKANQYGEIGVNYGRHEME